MTAVVYVPRDSSAVALRADAVAGEIQSEATRRKLDVTIVRNGSRGMFLHEPMVEVAAAAGRIAYGPVVPADVASLFDSNFLDGREHRLRLGVAGEIPWLKSQNRLKFGGAGVTDPVSLDDFIAHGGYRGLRRAIELGADTVIAEVTNSGLRGRGGAGFPTGVKWKTALDAPAAPKYVVCNADEGDSGAFSDQIGRAHV